MTNAPTNALPESARDIPDAMAAVETETAKFRSVDRREQVNGILLRCALQTYLKLRAACEAGTQQRDSLVPDLLAAICQCAIELFAEDPGIEGYIRAPARSARATPPPAGPVIF